MWCGSIQAHLPQCHQKAPVPGAISRATSDLRAPAACASCTREWPHSWCPPSPAAVVPAHQHIWHTRCPTLGPSQKHREISWLPPFLLSGFRRVDIFKNLLRLPWSNKVDRPAWAESVHRTRKRARQEPKFSLNTTTAL